MLLVKRYCVPLSTVLLLVLLPGRDANGTAPDLIQGSVITCDNEGQTVTVPWISDDPCITCHCQQGEVVCQKKTCPHPQGCYLLLFGRRPSCCDVCKGCLYDGTQYKNGDQWTDPGDSCITLMCQSGVITRSRIYCHVPCRDPTPPDRGQCCPSCGTCVATGNDSVEVFEAEDPCVECMCQNGSTVCYKNACPVLSCPPSKFVQPPNTCCPECRGSRRVFDLHGKCLLGMHIIRNRNELLYDQCTRCTCNDSTSVCDRTVCPPVQCPPDHQVTDAEECCPRCREPEEKRAACMAGGQLHQWLELLPPDGLAFRIASRFLAQGTPTGEQYQLKVPALEVFFNVSVLN